MVDNSFLLIAITPVTPIADESAKICRLLDHDFDFVHIRHPEITIGQMLKIIEDIPADLRSRIKIHDHHHLAYETGVGVHVNTRGGENVESPFKSTGCHSIQEITRLTPDIYEYVMLSPVFPSISKPGYGPSVDLLNGLKNINPSFPIIALGGVTHEKLSEIKIRGFSGAAMLGAVDWS